MTIGEVHDKLFDLLVIFDQICQQNEITYYLSGGSAIGAVREKDFIAWDDDIDVDIRGEDYPRFRKAMMDNLPSYLQLVEPNDFSPYFYDFAIRIIDTRWLLRKEEASDIAYKNYQNRIGIDVFLCCSFPEKTIGQKLFVLHDQILYGMCMAYRYETDHSKYSFVERIELAILRLLGKMYSGKNPERLIKRWYQFISSSNKTGWRYTVNAPFKKMYMVPMPERWFQTPTNGTIRGKKFPLMTEYHEALTMIYGDYMTPERNEKKYLTHM